MSVTSTGSVLVPESYDYVYNNVKEDLCLSSISGGTDFVSCFVLGSPILPVYRGESQCRGLGMAVDVFDETGQAVVVEKGELAVRDVVHGVAVKNIGALANPEALENFKNLSALQ